MTRESSRAQTTQREADRLIAQAMKEPRIADMMLAFEAAEAVYAAIAASQRRELTTSSTNAGSFSRA